MWKPFFKSIMFIVFVFPIIVHADALSNADIERYVKSYPLVKKVLDKINTRISTDKKLDIDLAMAQMEGAMHRKIIVLINGWPEQVQLKNILQKQGFSKLEDWALVADRIGGVIMSASWVMGAASMGSDKPLREDMNLFAYLDDNRNDMALRKKYRLQFGEMCDRLCYEHSDIEMVRKNYTKITSVLNNE